MAIDAREAAIKAKEYLQSLDVNTDPRTIQLEEIELFEEEGCWLITLSYISRDNPYLFPPPKEYKIFEIDYESGKVKSMKIKQLK